jgi:hypothetical protein
LERRDSVMQADRPPCAIRGVSQGAAEPRTLKMPKPASAKGGLANIQLELKGMPHWHADGSAA